MRAAAVGASVGRTLRSSIWPLALLLFAVAFGLLWMSASTRYVADLRFEAFAAPGRMLSSQLSLWIDSPGFGRVREGGLPAPLLVIGGLRALGLGLGLTERIWHAGLLALAGVGAAALLRRYRPQIGGAHVIAALLFAFNPVTAGLLTPSNLLLAYALSPWLCAFALDGVRGPSRWRPAAWFAVSFFVLGSTNPPAILYALLPALPLLVHEVFVARTARLSAVLTWGAAAAALCVAVGAASAVAVPYSFAALVGSIDATESPAGVNFASSWSETLRGMGFWLSYFRDSAGPWLPQTAAYLQSGPVVAASFLPAVVAAIGMWRSRWTPRWAFAAAVVLAGAFMVGTYPTSDPSPFGRLLLWVYRTLPGGSSLRNTYKAGPGLWIGIAILAAVALAEMAGTRAGRRRQLAGMVAVAVVMGASVSFWRGDAHHPDQQLAAVPSYWRDAARFVDAHPAPGRAWIIPGSQATTYRWGSPGDDIFDALLHRDHVVRTWLPTGGAQVSNLLAELDDRIQTGRLAPEAVAPIARKLGISLIVIRNDLDWERSDTARPVTLDAIREAPGLSRVATFGQVGQNVVEPGDERLAVLRELKLPPVEVYAVADPLPPARVEADGPPLIVAGDGAAWPALAARGWLDRPLRYSGDLAAERAAELLARPDARLVVTDTNRRRERLANGPTSNVSATLTAGAEAPTLFSGPRTQTVVEYPDVRAIEASGYGTALRGLEPQFRPANAFDRDLATAWLTAGIGDAEGSWIDVRLDRPRRVRAVRLVVAPSGDGRRVTAAAIRLSHGETVAADLTRGEARISLPDGPTTSVRVEITKVEGPGLAPVGFSEIELDGVDAREFLRLPEDLVAASATSDRLAAGAGRASFAVHLERGLVDSGVAEETAVRRIFRTPTTRRFELRGRIRVALTSADRHVGELFGTPVRGSSASPWYGGDWRNGGMSAVDGDAGTAWRAIGQRGEALEVRFPRRQVREVVLDVAQDPDGALLTSADLVAGGSTKRVTLSGGRNTVTFDGVVADAVTIRVASTSARGPGLPPPIAVREVEINGEANRALPALDAPAGCLAGAAVLDGRAVDLRPLASIGAVLSGASVAVEGCSSMVLPAGAHRFVAEGDLLVDELWIESLTEGSVPGAAAVESVSRSRAGDVEVQASGSGAVVLLGGRSFDRRWEATAGGTRLDGPVPIDAGLAWEDRLRGEATYRFRYGPQRLQSAASALTLVGLAVCAALIVRRSR